MRNDDDRHLLIGRANGVTFRRNDKSESGTVIPPAYIITDSDGGTWTFGTEFNTYGEIVVLRNDVGVGEFAQRIEYHNGVVWLFGKAGRRRFSRSRKHFV